MTATTLPTTDRSAHRPRATESTSPQLLVASDGSEAADGAIAVGGLIARRQHLEMEVLTVLSETRASLLHADEVERKIRRQLHRLGSDDECRIEVRAGAPAQVIAGVAREHRIELIVMGATRRGLRALLPGKPTLSRLLPIGDTPILSVPASARRLPSRLVIATDFSMPSIGAARAAVEIVGRFSRIDIVHVQAPETGPVFEWNHYEESYDGGVRGAFDRLLHDLGLAPSPFVETWTLAGDASSEILRFAERSGGDLIAVGGRDHGVLGRIRDRSVTHDLMQKAECSLLVAPRRPAVVWRARKRLPDLVPGSDVIDFRPPILPPFAFQPCHAR